MNANEEDEGEGELQIFHKKRSSMEEEYLEQRKSVSTTLDSLIAVRDLLQKK